MEHIRDPIVEPPVPFEGRNPQRGRTDKWRTRKSKRGEHGLATRHFDEAMQPRNMDNDGA
jgi:hypothetical protein